MAIVERDRIQQVIHCSWWQAHRLSMKGVDTVDKLRMCQEWLGNDYACEFATWKSCNQIDRPLGRPIVHVRTRSCGWQERRDQVLNYLTALSRGGQIEPLAEDVYKAALTRKPYNRLSRELYGDIRWDLIIVRKEK